jgi:hypothetical protein
VLGRIRIIGLTSKHEQPVGQCPVCEKFFCTLHAEKHIAELNAEELRRYSGLVARSGQIPYMLYCPLDLRVSLGRGNEQGAIYTSEDQEQLPDRAVRPEIIETILRGAAKSRGEICSICGETVLRSDIQMSFVTTNPESFKGALGGYCLREKIFVCGEHAVLIEMDEHTYISGCPQCRSGLQT